MPSSPPIFAQTQSRADESVQQQSKESIIIRKPTEEQNHHVVNENSKEIPKVIAQAVTQQKQQPQQQLQSNIQLSNGFTFGGKFYSVSPRDRNLILGKFKFISFLMINSQFVLLSS